MLLYYPAEQNHSQSLPISRDELCTFWEKKKRKKKNRKKQQHRIALDWLIVTVLYLSHTSIERCIHVYVVFLRVQSIFSSHSSGKSIFVHLVRVRFFDGHVKYILHDLFYFEISNLKLSNFHEKRTHFNSFVKKRERVSNSRSNVSKLVTGLHFSRMPTTMVTQGYR